MSQTDAPPRVVPGTDEGALDAAVRILSGGGIVAFPTDTVYGVGCDMWSSETIQRLYMVKGRPPHLAIPVLVSAIGHLPRVACIEEAGADDLVARFWPGALTIVLPRQPQVPDTLTAGRKTVAVRMPGHPLALALIERAGGALAVTSANRSGHAPARSASEVRRELGWRVALILDGGSTPIGVPSSIVDLSVQPPRMLREGSLTLADLRAILPDLRRTQD